MNPNQQSTSAQNLLTSIEAQADDKEVPDLPPVDISGDAIAELGNYFRAWSGWRDAGLAMGVPQYSPYAHTDLLTHEVTFDPRRLMLNPSRVMSVVTPFRMRQEAVITGTLMHEAAHARFTTWTPVDDISLAQFKHSDGSAIADPVGKFAMLVEEARIEGLMAGMVKRNAIPNAFGLDWTMKVASMHLLPLTQISDNPAQAVMDLVSSWVLRAGRAIATSDAVGAQWPTWVHDFDKLLHETIVTHLTGKDSVISPVSAASTVKAHLLDMIRWPGDFHSMGKHGGQTFADPLSPFMVDKAREVLTILFPETEDEGGDGAPSPSGGCGMASPDSGEGEGQGDDQGDGQGQGQPGTSPLSQEQQDALGDALDQMEKDADQETNLQAKAEEETSAPDNQPPPPGPGSGAGYGNDNRNVSRRWPTKAEREIAKAAERFLREALDPTEASKVSLSASPSAMVDGAALAAWKAGGQVAEPYFFRRTRREVVASPPIKIAVLVDVSGSMSELQAPSAVLSWALSSAAMNLRNFAGRGVQVQSTLIHWGSTARVMLRNNEPVETIIEHPCAEGTHAFGDALDLIETEIPGFLDIPSTPENRLIINFSDMDMAGQLLHEKRSLRRALEAGVNMLTVFPAGFSARRSDLDSLVNAAGAVPGRSTEMVYNENRMNNVWTEAAQALRG